MWLIDRLKDLGNWIANKVTDIWKNIWHGTQSNADSANPHETTPLNPNNSSGAQSRSVSDLDLQPEVRNNMNRMMAAFGRAKEEAQERTRRAEEQASAAEQRLNEAKAQLDKSTKALEEEEKKYEEIRAKYNQKVLGNTDNTSAKEKAENDDDTVLNKIFSFKNQ